MKQEPTIERISFIYFQSHEGIARRNHLGHQGLRVEMVPVFVAQKLLLRRFIVQNRLVLKCIQSSRLDVIFQILVRNKRGCDRFRPVLLPRRVSQPRVFPHLLRPVHSQSLRRFPLQQRVYELNRLNAPSHWRLRHKRLPRYYLLADLLPVFSQIRSLPKLCIGTTPTMHSCIMTPRAK